MEKKVTICDYCGEIITSEYGQIHLRSVYGIPMYQDQSFDEYNFDFCSQCASQFPKMFKEFIKYRKDLLKDKKV